MSLRCDHCRRPLGAQGALSESSLTIFVAQLGVLLLVGRLMGEAAQRIGQPHVMGQLIAGLLLGPSVLDRAETSKLFVAS